MSLAIILCGGMQSRGDEVSPWAADLRSAMRLIAGSNLPDRKPAPLRAGIELRLDPGWKTYWRYAGDSGLPPKFDFAGSENVQSVTVLWPAPRRFPDGAGGYSIGYMGGVIFPVHIVAEDPTKPVTLRAKLNYGVCEKVCIPAEGKTELPLTAGPTSKETVLAAAEAR
ncbi:MAG: protein-disulfide reductase DsbD domain-containing protein, partial [Xanthobacteraceae bacterium]